MNGQQRDNLRQKTIEVLAQSMPIEDATKIVDYGDHHGRLFDDIVYHVEHYADRIKGEYVYDDELIRKAIGNALKTYMGIRS